MVTDNPVKPDTQSKKLEKLKMKAMIFAAGQGTRLKPLTNTIPKALVGIGGITLLERCIMYLKNYDINDITVNIHHFGQQIRDFLQENNNFGITIHLSDETDQLLDTGGGILKARHFLEGNDPVLLINVDVLTNLNLSRLARAHDEQMPLASLVVRKRRTSRYLMFDKNMQLAGWKNVDTGETKVCRGDTIKAAVPFAFSGIHLIQPELFSKITETGKFSVIDLYLRLAASEKIMAYDDRESIWMDLGKYEEIGKAEELVKKI